MDRENRRNNSFKLAHRRSVQPIGCSGCQIFKEISRYNMMILDDRVEIGLN